MKSKWTFMVYMAGNNSLSGAASADLSELRKIGSTPDVNVLAFIKQSGGTGSSLQTQRLTCEHVRQTRARRVNARILRST